MTESEHEPVSFMLLDCGCLINEVSGEGYKECIPHVEVNFKHCFSHSS